MGGCADYCDALIPVSGGRWPVNFGQIFSCRDGMGSSRRQGNKRLSDSIVRSIRTSIMARKLSA